MSLHNTILTLQFSSKPSFQFDTNRKSPFRTSIHTRPGRRRFTEIKASSNNSKKKSLVSNSDYVVPIDKSTFSPYSSCNMRPLVEILRDLNKKVPDNIIKQDHSFKIIPWYHANRMLSFYAPGWCGEIRDVLFFDNKSVTVVYRLTVKGSDGEAHRESTGTVSLSNGEILDPVAAAEEIAFCKACARFGFGLHLYHEESLV